MRKGKMNSTLIKETIIILAGGESRRFQNRIKALENFHGLSLVGHRINSASKLFSKVIVSVSSDEIRLKCEDQLRSENVDFSNVIFVIDKEIAIGPMRAMLNVFPQITTKYCVVVGVDNLLIRNLDFQSLLKELILSDSSLISVVINKTRLVASYFAFETEKIVDLVSNNPFIQNFVRLTDLFRTVPKIALLEVPGTGQYQNINTPEELISINTEDPQYLEIRNCLTIEPNHFLNMGISCKSFLTELKCWSHPFMINHVIKNILKDARRELKDDFDDCNLEGFSECMKKENME